MFFPGLWRLVAPRYSARLMRGDLDGAERIARQFVRWRPSDPEAWNMLATVFLNRMELEQTEDVLRDGIQRVTDTQFLRLSLVELLMAPPGDRLEEARREISVFSSECPDSPLVFLSHALLALRAGDRASAETHCDAALGRLDPQSRYGEYVMHGCGNILLSIPERRQDGIGLLERVLKTWSENPDAHLALAAALEAEGRVEETDLHVKRARACWGDDEESFLRAWERQRENIAGKTQLNYRPSTDS